MKYKYPKKVRVGSAVFKVVYDKDIEEGSASFSYPREGKHGVITFGHKNHNKRSLIFLECIIHEIKEIIGIEQSTRFQNNLGNQFEFHYNHAQHSDMCSRLAGLLERFIK